MMWPAGEYIGTSRAYWSATEVSSQLTWNWCATVSWHAPSALTPDVFDGSSTNAVHVAPSSPDTSMPTCVEPAPSRNTTRSPAAPGLLSTNIMCVPSASNDVSPTPAVSTMATVPT